MRSRHGYPCSSGVFSKGWGLKGLRARDGWGLGSKRVLVQGVGRQETVGVRGLGARDGWLFSLCGVQYL